MLLLGSGLQNVKNSGVSGEWGWGGFHSGMGTAVQGGCIDSYVIGEKIYLMNLLKRFNFK